MNISNTLNALLILLIVLVILSFFSMRVKDFIKRTHLGRKGSRWFFVLYGAVLVISIPIFFMIPEQGFLYREQGFAGAPEGYFTGERVNIYAAAEENKLNETDGIMLLGKTNFTLPGEELLISYPGGFSDMPVFVRRKATGDGQITASFYATKTYYYGIDLSLKIKVPEMKVTGSKLEVGNLENEISLVEFRKDLIAAQFADPDTTSQFQGPGFGSRHFETGQRILYMEIPSNVEIKSDQLGVQFIGETI